MILSMLPDLSTISLTSWAGIVAIGAVLGTCWRYVRLVWSWFTDLFICKVALKDDASRAVQAWVWGKGRQSPFGMRLFSGLTTFVAPKRRVEVVGFETVSSEPRLFSFNKVPMVIKVGQGYGGKETNLGMINTKAMPCTLWYVRGTFNVDDLLNEAIGEYNRVRQDHETQTADKRKVKRFTVSRMHGHSDGSVVNGWGVSPSAKRAIGESGGSESSEDILQSLRRGEVRSLVWGPDDLAERPADDQKPFDCHPVSPTILEQLSEIDTWLKHEQWFRARGIPWYRGYLLHGPSGSGKSTIVRNIAVKHDLPVYVFDLSSYNNEQFTSDWKQVLQNAPAIALLEDIDCVFNGRENVAVKGKQRDGLTFDCLLNTLSGVGANDGVLLFVTTNHLEHLDPALGIPDPTTQRSTRPGRINRALYVGAMAEPERRKLATVILADYPDQIEPTIAAGEGEMAAQFQERCAQLALSLWNAGLRPSEVTTTSCLQQCAERFDTPLPKEPFPAYIRP